MAIEDLMTIPVTLHSASDTITGEDEHGNPTYTAETDIATTGYLTAHIAGERGADQIQSEAWRLFLPAGTTPTGWDAATVAGDRYEIIGQPEQVWNPRTNKVHHVEATIRRSA